MTDRALEGQVVWVTGSRKGDALARILQRHGARPHVVPTLDTRPWGDDEPAYRAVREIAAGRVPVSVFLTGVGVRALFDLAESVHLREKLIAGLNRGLVVARGPKARSALRGAGVRVDLEPAAPTAQGIYEVLAGTDLAGVGVAVQLHGREQPALLEGLRSLGARPVEVPLYRYVSPPDESPVLEWIGRALRGDVDAVTFTSPPAVLGVFATAVRAGREGALSAAFRDRVIVAAVGPSTADILDEFGTRPHVVAAPYTQPALVEALAAYARERPEPSLNTPELERLDALFIPLIS